MKALLIGLASSLHGKEYYEPLHELVTGAFKVFEGIEIVEKPVASLDELEINKLKNYDYLILLHLTGGTSGLATRIGVSHGGPIILLALTRHNSLASALSARAKLVDKDIKTRLIYFDNANDLLLEFTPLYQGIKAAIELKKMRILEINEDGTVSDKAKLFMEKIGGEVIAVSHGELLKIGREASREELRELEKHVRLYIDLSGTERDKLDDVLSIYYAMRKLVSEKGAEAISIDCFQLVVKHRITPCLAVAMMNTDGIPTACEDDFHSLVMLYLSLALTGEPGWIANPSGITPNGYLRFAHCTIAPSIGAKCGLTTHFESGHPYAVFCRFRQKRLLFGRLNLGYDKIKIYRGKVIESGLLEPEFCRTQLIVDTGPLKPEEFVEKAIGNHHVFMPWREDLEKMIEAFAWWMEWQLEKEN